MHGAQRKLLLMTFLIWVRGPIRAPASTIVATSSRRIIDSNYCLSPQAPAFNHGLLGRTTPFADFLSELRRRE